METCLIRLPAFWAPSLDHWHFKACGTTPLLPVAACSSHLVMHKAYVFFFPLLSLCLVFCFFSLLSLVKCPPSGSNYYDFHLFIVIIGVVSTIYKRLPSVLTSTCYTSESCCTSLIEEQRVGTPLLVGCTLIGATCSWSILLIIRSKRVRMCQVFWDCRWMLLAFDPPALPHRSNLLKLNTDSLPSLCLFSS